MVSLMKKISIKNQIPSGYARLLEDLKAKVRNAQVKAALNVNSEMIILYWEIGKSIVVRQEKEGWGTNIINRLSMDLKNHFPELKGFSPRNLGYMKKMYEKYPDFVILQQLAAKLPWFHNCILIDKVKTQKERLWYLQQAIANGWSRNVLVHQIELKLYKRQASGKKITNFKNTLPKIQSELAAQTLKDPYIFDFLSVGKEAHEREIENELTKHITKFLLELGAGFSFVGQQVHLEVGKKDYYIDLLFYHLKLRSYVIIELKAGSFKPEYAGKINFYLSAVDDILRHPSDNPSVGIILCQDREKITAEYALRDIKKPIGISQYKITHAIPEKIKGSLPTIEELEVELSKNIKNRK